MFWNSKKVLVTGSSGFIGTHLVNHLLSKNADVTALDIKLPNTIENNSKFHSIVFDINKDQLPIDSDFDVIFHLAATAAPLYCQEHPEIAFNTNVHGLYNVVNFAAQNNIPKLVFTSSAQLYGRDPQYLPIDEKHTLDPTQNVYTVTKKLGEDICNMFQGKNITSFTIFRLFNVFGPFQNYDYFIPTMIRQAIEKGKIELWSKKPTRDWNYVDNAIEALLKAGESEISNIFNVGGGIEIPTEVLAHKISSKYNADLKFLDKEVSGSLRLQCDYSKIKDVLGWEPKISFEKGLEQTLNWYEKKHKTIN